VIHLQILSDERDHLPFGILTRFEFPATMPLSWEHAVVYSLDSFQFINECGSKKRIGIPQVIRFAILDKCFYEICGVAKVNIIVFQSMQYQ